tara:strand:- start:284 stop:931 length:648 start_codon:yes stop_codon:yes gene_type:complete
MEALSATTRLSRGKGSNRRLRAQGQLPAVVYGLDQAPVTLSVDPSELRRILMGARRRNTLIGLSIDDGDAIPVLVREIQTNSVTREILHTDFVRVDPSQPVVVKVPVVTTGKSIGVDAGGRLKVVRRQVNLRVRPEAVPAEFAIDVTNLNEGQSIRISACDAPEASEILFETDYVVVQCVTGRASRAAGAGGDLDADGEDGAEAVAAAGESTSEE